MTTFYLLILILITYVSRLKRTISLTSSKTVKTTKKMNEGDKKSNKISNELKKKSWLSRDYIVRTHLIIRKRL